LIRFNCESSPQAMRGQKAATVVHGKDWLVANLAAGNTSVGYQISSATFPKLSNVQKGYEFYRFTKFRVKVLPAARNDVSSGPGQVLAVGWYPDQTATALTAATVSGVLSLSSTTLKATGVYGGPFAYETTPSSFSVSKKVLSQSPVKWFRTNVTVSGEDAELYHGTLLFAVNTAIGAAGAMIVNCEVTFSCEFAGEVDATALTLFRPPSKQEQKDSDSDFEPAQMVKAPIKVRRG